jgi:hypothetical protein
MLLVGLHSPCPRRDDLDFHRAVDKFVDKPVDNFLARFRQDSVYI